MQFVINGIVAGALYSLVALGFSLIFSTARFFHFAHGALYCVAAYLVYFFASVLGWTPWVAVPCAVGGVAFLGGLVELGVYRPLRHRRASSDILLVASLGLFIVLQNLISLAFGDATKLLRSGPIKEGVLFLGARITPIQIDMVIAAVICITVLGCVLRFSGAGKKIRAVADDSELAQILGVHTDRVVLGVFTSGSILAGVAAILAGFDSDITPLMGFSVLFMAVVAAIIGGVGSIGGAALGGLLLGLTQQFVAATLSTRWQEVCVFVLLIVFLILRPEGILGKPLRKARI